MKTKIVFVLLLALISVTLAQTIDSVWFWEETDCNDSNIVHICYILSGDTASISISISPDSGETWVSVGEDWLATLFDTLGDFGYDILPGTHCFDWVMSTDMPDTESRDWLVEVELEALLDTFMIIDSIDVTSPYGWGLAHSDGFFWMYYLWNGYLYKKADIHPDSAIIDSIFLCDDCNTDIDYRDGYIYYSTNKDRGVVDDTIKRMDFDSEISEVIYASPYPDNLESVQFIDSNLFVSNYDAATIWQILKIDMTMPIPVSAIDTIIEEPRSETSDIEGMAYALGYLWGVNNFGRLLQVNPVTFEIVESHPVPNSGSGAEGLCWDGNFMWYQNNILGKIYKIVILDSTTSDVIVAGPLDSRRPEVELTAPTEPLIPGDSCRIDWTITDLFRTGDSCEIHIFGCGIDEYYIVGDTTFVWPVPIYPCPECTVVVTVRDSFCNRSSDTTTVSIAQRARQVEFPWIVGNRCDTVLVPLYIDSLHSTWLDSAVMRFAVDPEVLVPIDIITDSSFTALWFITDFAVFPDLGIIEAKGYGTPVYGDTGGVLIYMKAYVPCNAMGGSYTTIAVDTMRFNNGFPQLSWINGLFVVELEPQDFSCDLRLNRAEGEPTEDLVLTFAANAFGTDDFDPGIDIQHVPPPLTFVDGWFPMHDTLYPVIDKLIRDTKLSEPPKQWVVVSGDEPNGLMHWDPGRFPEGEFRMDGMIDMKRDTIAYFDAHDTMIIDWTLPSVEIMGMAFEPGWNMVSSPLLPNEMPAHEVFQTEMGVFRYDTPRSSYDIADYVRDGEGYWIWVEDSLEIAVVGALIESYRRQIYRGWNLIGALGTGAVPVGEIEITPVGSIIGDILGWDGSDYFSADSLLPGNAYWMLSNGSGQITVGP